MLGQASLLVLNQGNQRVDNYRPARLAYTRHLIDEALASAGRQQDGAVASLHDLDEGLQLALPEALLCKHRLKDFRERPLHVLKINIAETRPHGRFE